MAKFKERLTLVQLFLLFCFKAIVAAIEKDGTPAQIRLVRDLFHQYNYDVRVRPVHFPTDSINATVKIEPYLLVEVNEAKQAVTINMWVMEMWQDQLLVWNPDDYDGIRRLNLPYNSIWRPDSCLFNTLVVQEEVIRSLYTVELETNPQKNSTSISLRYPVLYTAWCHIDVMYFPFDQQNCIFIFGSYTSDSSLIDYKPLSGKVNTTNFLENPEWSLHEFTAIRKAVKFPCCSEPWAMLHFSMKIERRPLFYITNLIIPTIVIAIVSILGLFTPSSSEPHVRTERVTLGITTLLAMSIVMLMVSDSMPSTSSYVPLLGWFFLLIIGLISFASLMTTLVLTISKRGYVGIALPAKTVRRLIIVAKFCGITPPKHLCQIDKPNTSLKVAMDPNCAHSNDTEAEQNPVKNYFCTEANSVLDRKADPQQTINEWYFYADLLERVCCIVSLLVLLFDVLLFFIIGMVFI